MRGGQLEIATPLLGGEVVATVGSDGAVSVWSVEEAALITRFRTAWEFGGRRLALCGTVDRPIVIAGAWGRPGVIGYDGRSGEELWERRDLTRSDMIAPAGDGGSAHRHVGVTRT